ncbi:MAG TPA: PHB depolymerase family esterase [Lichenihabitans sp.]|jgi:phospholipase/carboxylesterase|nr:PHB depolymerase family esterase [Lichenihabitans sp.]
MAATLDGPRVPARSGEARHLVVFLHGYGADGNDLIELGRQWQAWLPDAAFVAPHAPERCAQASTGRQWFSLTTRDDAERWTGVNKAAPGLDAFIDAELARHGIDDRRLALVGFSQGTMMALHVGLRRARPPAGILGYSGVLVGAEHLGEAAASPGTGRKPPPVLLVHGDADNVIPVEALFTSAESLGKAEVPTQWHLSFGVAHGIDQGGLKHGGQFLAQCFGLRTPG